MRKTKRFDSVLWQNPLHSQKNPKSKVTKQRHQNFDITTIADRFILYIYTIIWYSGWFYTSPSLFLGRVVLYLWSRKDGHCLISDYLYFSCFMSYSELLSKSCTIFFSRKICLNKNRSSPLLMWPDVQIAKIK